MTEGRGAYSKSDCACPPEYPQGWDCGSSEHQEGQHLKVAFGKERRKPLSDHQ